MYLLDRALGVKSWLNVTTICSYPEPWKIKPQPPESPEFETNMAFQHGLREYEVSIAAKFTTAKVLLMQ